MGRAAIRGALAGAVALRGGRPRPHRDPHPPVPDPRRRHDPMGGTGAAPPGHRLHRQVVGARERLAAHARRAAAVPEAAEAILARTSVLRFVDVFTRYHVQKEPADPRPICSLM